MFGSQVEFELLFCGQDMAAKVTEELVILVLVVDAEMLFLLIFGEEFHRAEIALGMGKRGMHVHFVIVQT